MASTVECRNHDRISPISIASSDHNQDSDEDELPAIFQPSSVITASSGKTWSSSKSGRSSGIGSSCMGGLTSFSKQAFKAKAYSNQHIDISNSDSDSELDIHKVKGHAMNVATIRESNNMNGKERGGRPLTVDVDSDPSDDEDDYIQLGLLHRLQAQSKKFKSSTASKSSSTVKRATPNSTSLSSSNLMKSSQHKIRSGSTKCEMIKEAIFSQVSSRRCDHTVSESDDDSDAESMDTQGVYSEETTSTCASTLNSQATCTSYSQTTDSLDSQTLMSQESCSSSSTSQKRTKRTTEEIEAAKRQALVSLDTFVNNKNKYITI